MSILWVPHLDHLVQKWIGPSRTSQKWGYPLFGHSGVRGPQWFTHVQMSLRELLGEPLWTIGYFPDPMRIYAGIGRFRPFQAYLITKSTILDVPKWSISGVPQFVHFATTRARGYIGVIISQENQIRGFSHPTSGVEKPKYGISRVPKRPTPGPKAPKSAQSGPEVIQSGPERALWIPLKR